MAQKKDEKRKTWFYYGSYIDKHGKRIQYKKRGFETKRDARMAEDAFREEAKRAQTDITLYELMDLYFEQWKIGAKDGTVSNNENIFNKIKAHLGNKYITDYTLAELNTFINEMDLNYSRVCVLEYVSKIKAIFEYAQMNGYLEKNVAQWLKPPKRNEQKKDINFWEKHEFDIFIQYVTDATYKTVFMILYYMGLRKGEACALKWDDIDFKNKTMTVNKTITPHSSGRIATPKTKNSYRTISMPDVLIEQLRAWEGFCSEFYCDDGFIFGDVDAGYRVYSGIRRNLQKYINIANENGENLQMIRVHDLRHSHASYLINNMKYGFTDYDIAKRLGDTVTTLHNVYAHWFKDADKDIINFMNNN